MPKNPFYADKVILKNGGVIETEGGISIVEVDANGTPSIKANIEDALADGNIFVGDSNGVTSEVAMSGQALISNTGVVTIQDLDSSTFAHPKIVVYQETVTAAALTDGGAAEGTFVLSTTIPAGAVFQGTAISSLVGFAGDTTATAVIGDGTDVDRYNAGTPDVFSTDVAGIAVGQPSGTTWHAADIATVTVTVTSATDIGLVIADGNGSMLVTLTYLDPQGVIV